MYNSSQTQTKSVTQTISSPVGKPRHRNLIDSLMKKIIKDKNTQLAKNGSNSSPTDQLPLVRIPTVKSDFRPGVTNQADSRFGNLSHPTAFTLTPSTECDSQVSRKSSGVIDTFDHFETGPQQSLSETLENVSPKKSDNSTFDSITCTDQVSITPFSLGHSLEFSANDDRSSRKALDVLSDIAEKAAQPSEDPEMQIDSDPTPNFISLD